MNFESFSMRKRTIDRTNKILIAFLLLTITTKIDGKQERTTYQTDNNATDVVSTAALQDTSYADSALNNQQAIVLPDISIKSMLDKNVSFSNLTALSNYKGYLDPELVASINPFWLDFPPQPQSAHYALGFIYSIMMVLGLSGNALVIFMFIRCKSLRTPANTLVINLAVSDFLMVCEIPVLVYNSFSGGPTFSALGCRIYGFTGALTGTLSIATLTFISVDRYNVVVYPLNPLRSTTKWRSRIMVIIAWLFSLFWAGIPLIEQWGFCRYSPEGFLTTCSFDYLADSEKERWFMFLYCVFAWVVPLLLIAYCYIHILRVVIGANSIQSSKDKNKTEIKLAIIVMGVIGLWFAAWTPYAIVAMLGIVGKKSVLSPLGSMIPAIFAKSAAIIDPFVYAVTHPRFRLEFGKMFLGHTDTRPSQFQTSVSRATVQPNRDAVQLNDRPATKRGPLERGATSLCESELSLSVDLSDSAMPDTTQS